MSCPRITVGEREKMMQAVGKSARIFKTAHQRLKGFALKTNAIHSFRGITVQINTK